MRSGTGVYEHVSWGTRLDLREELNDRVTSPTWDRAAGLLWEPLGDRVFIPLRNRLQDAVWRKAGRP